MGDGTPSLGEKAQQLSIVSTSYYLGLYQQAWAASVETVFSSKDILRDHPSHRATIEDLPFILTFKYNDSDRIVRAEYLAAYEDILDMFTSASGVPTRPSSSNVSMSEMCTLLSAIESHDVNHVRRLGGVDINGLSGIGNVSLFSVLSKWDVSGLLTALLFRKISVLRLRPHYALSGTFTHDLLRRQDETVPYFHQARDILH